MDMKLYTEEQVKKVLHPDLFYLILPQMQPIELQSGLDTFKKIIEDRPGEFSQYNAYTLLFVIDLIQNGKEVPEQMELIKMIREKK